MTYMELEFPGDADGPGAQPPQHQRRRAVAVDCRRNRPALYGLSRRSRRDGSSPRWAACCCSVAPAAIATPTKRWASIPREPEKTPAARSRGSAGTHVEESITINRPIEDATGLAEPREPAAVHAAPRVGRARHRHLVALACTRARREDRRVERRDHHEVPNKVIGWRSNQGSDVISAGSVNFDDAGPGRGTRVRVRLQYSPPGGKVGAAVAGCSAATPRRRSVRICGASNRSSRQAKFRRPKAAARMKALCWSGTNDVRVARVPEPKILNPRDAIVKVTLTAICGSDLHLLDGFIPTMHRGDMLGHEFMGEVVEVGRDNQG